MRLIALFVLCLFASSCSTRSNLAKKYGVDKKVLLSNVPFIAQKDFECGPATLAMYLKYRGRDVPVKTLVSQAFTPGKLGSLQTDMVTAVRRQGLIPVPVYDFKNILLEINAANPVVILQNLGFSWYPKWHYSLVIGYNLEKSEVIMHSGEKPSMSMKLKPFENTWKRSENWGFVIMEPGKLPRTASELEMVEAVASLEAMNFIDEAKASYLAILKKWPASLGGLIGLSNVFYYKKKFKQASSILREATSKHPTSAMAWHNYAWALKATNKDESARAAANNALSMPDDELMPQHRQNLHQLLDSYNETR
ncbi:MAG TPA: PA2778 family cysteine peptidase [Bacteriovoracaceae bacterium]|nr:PA2778 family cysteine peptidase [Bacteriovoracaceae bacterium]